MEEAPPSNFDRLRWKDARWSRWSFRNTSRFLPVAPIAPSRHPRDLPIATEWRPAGFDDFLAATHATSAILMIDGGIVAQAPAEAAINATPHMLFSITKSVVGLVARLLIDRHEIDAAQPARRYLPDLASSAFGEATLEELLAMRDGVAFDESYADPDADIHVYSRGYWGDAQGGARARLAALPPQPRRPGFSYRTPVADVVGAVLTAGTGERLAALVQELLWQPMGAAHPAHFVLDTAGVEIAGAGLNAAPSDLIRLAALLLDGGTSNGREVFPERVIDGLFDGGDPDAFASGYSDRPGWSYRDLWWHMGRGRIAALGVHGQRLIIDRERRFALVRTGAQPAPDNRPFDRAHADLLAAIESGRAAALSNEGVKS